MDERVTVSITYSDGSRVEYVLTDEESRRAVSVICLDRCESWTLYNADGSMSLTNAKDGI